MHAIRIAFRRARACRRSFSIQSVESSSDESTAVHKMMPSENFMKKFIKRPSQRDRLASLISEVDMFLDIFGKDSLPEFDDSTWTTFFGTWSAEERCKFLDYLRRNRASANSSSTPEREKISVLNKQREERGEMVYAPDFMSLLELRGQEFRRTIDRMYGSRLLSMKRNDESLPKLVVDCRFLAEYSVVIQSSFARQIQMLHDSNWTSRLPFDITLANFRPDSRLAEIVKRHWFFHYGPSSAGPYFSPHIFAPNLSTKSIADACRVDPSEIMYISWRAKQFLPDVPPPTVRAVVLCASNDYQPWSSSVSAAQKDGITPYRIPLERYVRFERMAKVLPLSSSSSILRSYFRGDDLGPAIRNAFVNRKGEYPGRNDRELFEQFKTVVQEAVAKAEAEAPYPSFKKKSGDVLKTKKPKVHRYSREERRKMRETEAAH